MKSGLIENQTANRETRVCPVSELPRDLARMLRVQWKEFVNSIEDVEFAHGKSEQDTSKEDVWALRLLHRAMDDHHYHKAS